MDKQAAYRSLPAVHKLLGTDWAQELLEKYSHHAVTTAIADVLDALREELDAITQVKQSVDDAWWQQRIAATTLEDQTQRQLEQQFDPVLKQVLNLTGVVVHTNLGRAPLSERAIEAVRNVAAGYSNLEYNLTEGVRGSRHDLVEQRICQLTGAEAAMVVNNNAAAVFLVLRELARGGEAIVSRGELVEIGGSFRIPSIMQESGVRLVEVGTTNKTHLADYENAVTDETKLLLRVHTSNFRIIGFTERPPLSQLSSVAQSHDLFLYEDLGSGALVDFKKYGIGDEMTVRESLEAGVDVVSFSGDKLLGGAQAGIIAGRFDIIKRLKKNQLARVLRVDKMTLAALEATLIESLDDSRATAAIPVARMLTEKPDVVLRRAEVLAAGLRGGLSDILGKQAVPYVSEGQEENRFSVQVVEEPGRIGGGALPEEELFSYAVGLQLPGVSAQRLFDALRQLGRPPVVGHIVNDTVRLNVKTLLPGQENVCIDVVVQVCTHLLKTG